MVGRHPTGSSFWLLALAVIGGLLAGCAEGGREGAAPAPGAGSQEPKVRRLVMGVGPPGTESNAPRLVSVPDKWHLRPIYEHLIGIDPESGRFVPHLASEWNVEPDGKSYRFKLRRGIQFHGGYGEFTAKDVVLSWEDATRDDALGTGNVLLRRLVDRVEIVHDYEVVFHLNAPDVGFESVVSQQESYLPIMSKAQYEAVRDPSLLVAPIAGTGPYQFKERAQGSFIRFERTPFQHWRLTPDFPEFEFRFQNEASSRLAALLTGEIQLTNLPADLLPQAEREGFKGVRGRVPALRTFLSTQCCFVHAQSGEYPVHPTSPLLGVRVRQALNKAIDRAALNRAFFAGQGELMYLNHFHPTREGWNPDWVTRYPDEYGYDPARARALLAEGGQPNLRTNLILRSLPFYSGAEDVTEAVAGYWRAVGVEVQLVQIDPGEVTAGQRALRYENHFLIVGTSATQLVGYTAYNSATTGLYLGAQHPDLEAIFKQIRVELDGAKRADLWRRLGDGFYERHLDVPLFWLPAEAVVDPRVIAEYVWPGSISGTWTHPEHIKAVR